MSDYLKELQIATLLAKAAGDIILEKRTEALANIQEKDDDEGPVTEADLAADHLISTGLQNVFPEDTLITEETWPSSDPLPQQERMWFVDPLDGTSDFARGGADYAVMIGLCVAGTPTLGVVYHPVSEIFWSGYRNKDGSHKAFKSHQGIHKDIQTRPFNPDRATALISRSHPSKTIDQMLDKLGLNLRITRGSVGLKGGALAHGEADIYITATNRIKVWDTCAPQIILEAAGGQLTGLLGTKLRYDQNPAHPLGVCAASKDAHQYFQPKIAELWGNHSRS